MYKRFLQVCLLVLVLFIQTGFAIADDLDLFENLPVAPSPANVLFIIDNSESMQNCPGTNNSADKNCYFNTKLKIVRDVFLEVINSERAQELRLGLMAYVKDRVAGNGEGAKILAPLGSPIAELRDKIRYIVGGAGPGEALPRPNNPDQSDPLYQYFDASYSPNLYPFNSNTGSPLGEALAEAGLYFAGEQSAFQASWPAESCYNSTELATIDGVSGAPWYQNSAYVSPITASCQKNYVVFVTDGYPDDDFLIDSGTIMDPYLPGKPPLVDRSGEGIPTESWDDVAAYLYDHDLNASLAGVQNVETIVITFDISPDGTDGNSSKSQEFYKNDYQDAFALMKQTAKDGNGGAVGNYYDVYAEYPVENSAENNLQFSQDLEDQLYSVMTTVFEDIISETNSVYATPAVPRNPENLVDAGDNTYMAFFKPTQDGRWLGNLKAYGLQGGVLMDSRSTVATPLPATGLSGIIKTTARSYWDVDNMDDGLEVHLGGAGEVLAKRVSDSVKPRKVFTYTDIDATDFLSQETDANYLRLLDARNQFTPATNTVLNNLLTSIYNSATPPVNIDADALINKVLSGKIYTDLDGTDFFWFLGDFVHSEPLVQKFDKDCNGDGSAADDYIFVGSNDGMLHTFCAANGEEGWAFIPPSQLGRLNLIDNGQHEYFVDGSPVIVDIPVPNTTPVNTQKLLIFGEGRGGQRYVALDFTTNDDPSAPHWRYQVTESILKNKDFGQVGFVGNAAILGQAWAKPQFKKIRNVDDVTGVETLENVFLLTGGYDPRYETASFPASVPQVPEIQGRSVYTVKAADGSVLGLNINGGNFLAMKHSIVEVTGFDAGDRGYMDRIYAGDLGGNLFAVTYNAADDIWQELVLLSLPDELEFRDSLGNVINDAFGNPVTGTLGKKLMTRPEITLEPDGECVYFGTGDREHPLSEGTTDVFYAVCHDWEKQIDDISNLPKKDGDKYVYEPIYPADTNGDGILDSNDKLTDVLIDVTDNLVQDSADASERATVESSLKSNSGWFIRMENPGEKIVSTPKIIDGKIFFTTFAPSVTGAQILDPCNANFDLGVSRLYALDYRTGAAAFEFDDSYGLSKDDRSIVVGNLIPYEPLLITNGMKTTLMYGSGGKLVPKPVSLKNFLRKYFWRQIK